MLRPWMAPKWSVVYVVTEFLYIFFGVATGLACDRGNCFFDAYAANACARVPIEKLVGL